ncbi:MAG TPA: isoprenylcysteine carboxylmethyltransferase family protein [Acidobacteriaceae bacterium]|nr:isoprenylcysteine carboxylmethyltransferase family protein [Acidobacteriaceae bacterium]
MLLLRLALFTVLVPGVVAGYLPWSFGPRHLAHGAWQLGWLLIVAGTLVYLLCATRFFAAHGTPAIFFIRPLRAVVGEEPSSLVLTGLYRYSRNPMYVGVLLVILGQACIFDSRAILQYAVFVFICFHLVVVLLEEPHLRNRDPAAFDEFTRRTPRWLGPHHKA